MKKSTPEIICMCGSTKFADLMAVLSWEFEKAGKIVLRVNYVPEWYVTFEGWTESSHGAEQSGLKEQLDELHCRKIDMCDRVYVCNFNGYMGDSTRAEIAYAKSIGKPIQYLFGYDGDTKMPEFEFCEDEMHDKFMEICMFNAEWHDAQIEGEESLRLLLRDFTMKKIEKAPVDAGEVDEFLRCHPEYRCLDVIGKFSLWRMNEPAK